MALTDIALCVLNDRDHHPALVRSCQTLNEQSFIYHVRTVVRQAARGRMYKFGTPYTDADLETATNQVWADIHRHVKEL